MSMQTKISERILLAKKVLKEEAEAILNLIDRLDSNFDKAIDILLNCKGRVVVTGIGKSGLICKKIAATLASTGTPAFFLHSADAVHGDLGMVVKGDVVIAISKSGQSQELIRLIPIIKRLGVKLITITANPDSELAKASDVVLNIGNCKEADPFDIAPTSSTTVSLALGDAIAMVLLQEKGFKIEDFAFYHPGGLIGKKLKKVKDLMKKGDELPIVTEDTLMKDTIYVISSKGLGVTTVVNKEGKLTGIITDGDLRRAMSRDPLMLEKPSKLFMTKNPKIIDKNEYIGTAVKIMEKYVITALLIVDEEGKPEGVLKLQDIIKEGII